MINRALLRIKVVQVLYAYYKNEHQTKRMAEKELDKSIEQAHDLYLFLLSLIPALTRYAELEIDNRRNKYIPTDADLNPNTRFADNILAKQMAESHVLADFAARVSYSWTDDDTFLKTFFEYIVGTPHYQSYMTADVRSYEADKELWRKIFKVDIPACEILEASIGTTTWKRWQVLCKKPSNDARSMQVSTTKSCHCTATTTTPNLCIACSMPLSTTPSSTINSSTKRPKTGNSTASPSWIFW